MPVAWTSSESVEWISSPLIPATGALTQTEAGAEFADRAPREEAEDLVDARLFPRGSGCCQGWRLLHEEQRRILEEARALQGGGCATQSTATTPSASISVLKKVLWRLCPKFPMACGILASVLLTTASFCCPWAQGRLFDTAVEAYQRHAPVADCFMSEIAPLLGLLGGLFASTWALECAVGILFAVAAHTTLTRLRAAMFSNLVQQDVAFYDAHVSGELSSRLINDSGQLQGLVQFVSQDFLQAFVRITGALVAMYLTHPWLALLATIITPVNWLIIRRAGRVQGRYGLVQNATMAKANAAAVEALGAIRTVHSNAGEMGEARLFASAIGRYLRVVLVTVHGQTVVIFTQLLLSRLRDVAVLSVGMHEVVAGEISIGSFTAFVQYVSLFEAGFSSMANIWLSVTTTLLSASRFVQLLDRRPDVRAGEGHVPSSCAGHLVMRDVSFSYPGSVDRIVLRDLTLDAPPGSIVALVGASGAGKSTVARLIQRFYDPTGGRILLDGHHYPSLELRWLRRQIGFVEQEPTLFDRSLSDNIRYGAPDATDDEVVKAATLANASEFIDALPEGYQTRPGERGVRISGGQKQRIAIARAVLKRPKLLLLDEATSALDSANEAQVQLAMDKLMERSTTVVIAHRLSTVVRATTIIVMKDGVAVERGTHNILANNPTSHYAEFMRHQLVPSANQ